jgi:signal transduction histidine kinase
VPLFAAAPPVAKVRNVLVLYSNNRMVLGNIEVDRGLTQAMGSNPDRQVRVFSESLDWPYFRGEANDLIAAAYLRQKYLSLQPDVIVAVSEGAFEFVLRKRAALFPQAPVVHVHIYRHALLSRAALPPDVVGVPVEYDSLGTIRQALRWSPAATKLVIVTGASDRDRAWESRLREEVPAAVGKVSVEFLAGQTSASVAKRLKGLGPSAVVFTPGFYEDEENELTTPRQSVAMMAAASTAPVYGPLNTFIGTGAVGGRTPSFEEMGRAAALLVEQLLAGADPSSLQVPALMPTALRVDWRQVQRWGIDERAIPADAVISFREPEFWETNRRAVILAFSVILLQAALIAALLLEHRRRRRAELAVNRQRIELWHASRLAVAGELTASIAHEINQPLGAILTNADAGELLLQRGGDSREHLRRIIGDIRRDDLRASDVIRRLRALLAKHDAERIPFDANDALADVVNLLGSEAARRAVTLDFHAGTAPARVVGDRVQFRQVIINLVLNAIESAADVADERRKVVMSVEDRAQRVRIIVRDGGHGIAPEHMPHLFESFFSTKQAGMGLGLSIARTIVESHGGRIWAEPGCGTGPGATFTVELPLEGASVAMPA